MADLVGWIGNIFFMIGMLRLAKKHIDGFWYNSIGNIMYVFQGLYLKTTSLWILSIFLICINIYGIVQWTKTEYIENE